LPPINLPTCPRFFRWQPAAWLGVSGPDAATFLQGQFTQELRGLAPGEARYGLWLSLKGKVEADSFVIRAGGVADAPAAAGGAEFFIASYFSPGAALRERLENFIIADDVVVEDLSARVSGVSVWPGAAGAIAAPAGVGAAFPGRRGAEPNAEWIFPREREAEVLAGLPAGARELGAGAVEALRIAAAIPAVPRDIGPGDLPNEAGLDAVAISYTKGCYLGQEVMARLKSMGQVRRRLLRVERLAGAAEMPPPRPALPAALFAGERQVGELRSAVADPEVNAPARGLAMLSLLHVAPGAELALAKNGPPVFRVGDVF
jgi:folate-binding protein YgfZ